jgi:hypothetical protein
MSEQNAYFNNEDIKKSFEYIRNLPERSRELINYYSYFPDLNSIYKTPGLSCNNINLLHKMFDESPRLTTELKVYRGLSIPNQNRISFDIDRLISTSTSYKIAKEFINLEDEKKFIMEITLKPGVNFLAISLPDTMFSSQNEILLPPGGSFNVISDEIINVEIDYEIFDIRKIHIDYHPKPSEINCVQSVLDLDQQYTFLYNMLLRKSTEEYQTFILSISRLLDTNSNIKTKIKMFLSHINELYIISLIEHVVKSDSFDKNMVYKAYFSAFTSLEKQILDFLSYKKNLKYNKFLSKVITKLTTIVEIDRVSSGKLFKFNSSGN